MQRSRTHTHACVYYRHEINYYIFKYVKTAQPLGSTDLEKMAPVQICAVTDPSGIPNYSEELNTSQNTL